MRIFLTNPKDTMSLLKSGSMIFRNASRTSSSLIIVSSSLILRKLNEYLFNLGFFENPGPQVTNVLFLSVPPIADIPGRFIPEFRESLNQPGRRLQNLPRRIVSFQNHCRAVALNQLHHVIIPVGITDQGFVFFCIAPENNLKIAVNAKMPAPLEGNGFTEIAVSVIEGILHTARKMRIRQETPSARLIIAADLKLIGKMNLFFARTACNPQ